MTVLDFVGSSGTAVRPARNAAGRQPWAKDASSPAANDGTRLDATFINDLSGMIRGVFSAYGVTPTPGDDAALAIAINAGIDAKIADLHSPLFFAGTWNASTNVPALASGVGTPGAMYTVATAGTTSIDGITDWQVLDKIVFNGTTSKWERIDGQGELRAAVSITEFASFQAAVDNCVATGRSLWLTPGGSHRPPSTVTIPDDLLIFGAGWLTTSIQPTDGGNYKLLRFTGGRPDIRDVAIFGAGIDGVLDITTISGNAHAIHLDGCVDANLERLYINGGYHCILNDAADTVVDKCFIAYALGTASIRNRGIALWMKRAKCDQSWPVSCPAYGYAGPSARINSHHYDVGETCTLSGFVLQAKTAGTTASSPPALRTYFLDIADGGVVWQLAGPVTSFSLLIDTGASETHIEHSDFTGCWQTAAIGLRNNDAGTAPYLTFISDSVISQSPGGSIDATDGKGLFLDNNEIAGGLATGSSAVTVRNNWAGDLNAVGNSVYSGGNGFYLGAGARNRGYANSIGGFVGAAVSVKAGVSDWDFSFNETGTTLQAGPNGAALVVEAGGSDHWKFVGNDTRGTTGAAIQDSSTGTDKTIHSNGIGTVTAWPHDMLPTGDNLYNLGSGSKRWNNIHVSQMTNYGDESVQRTFVQNNAGLFLRDIDNTNWLNVKTTSNLTTDRVLNFAPGDANRTVTLTGDPTLADWFDQAVKSTSSPTFAAPVISGILTTQSGQVRKVRVVTAAGAVAAAATDDIIVVNKTVSEATTVNLPASPTTGQTLEIKDGKGDALSYPITLVPAAGNIDGAANFLMAGPYQSATVAYNGTQWNVI